MDQLGIAVYMYATPGVILSVGLATYMGRFPGSFQKAEETSSPFRHLEPLVFWSVERFKSRWRDPFFAVCLAGWPVIFIFMWIGMVQTCIERFRRG